jgi:hypothetical protein
LILDDYSPSFAFQSPELKARFFAALDRPNVLGQVDWAHFVVQLMFAEDDDTHKSGGLAPCSDGEVLTRTTRLPLTALIDSHPKYGDLRARCV